MLHSNSIMMLINRKQGNKEKKTKKQETDKSELIKLECCIVAIRNWIAVNWLKLNDDMTDLIVL